MNILVQAIIPCDFFFFFLNDLHSGLKWKGKIRYDEKRKQREWKVRKEGQWRGVRKGTLLCVLCTFCCLISDDEAAGACSVYNLKITE